MDIQRYIIQWHRGETKLSPDGQWVRHSDFLSALSKSSERVKELEGTLEEMVSTFMPRNRGNGPALPGDFGYLALSKARSILGAKEEGR